METKKEEVSVDEKLIESFRYIRYVCQHHACEECPIRGDICRQMDNPVPAYWKLPGDYDGG